MSKKGKKRNSSYDEEDSGDVLASPMMNDANEGESEENLENYEAVASTDAAT
jgi:hypothetical protein